MKVIKEGDQLYLTWGYHELAHSLRTSGFKYYFFDDQGQVVGEMFATKAAGQYPLPPGARYFYQRYYTLSRYPIHTVYRLPELKPVLEIRHTTEVEDILQANIPDKLKKFIIGDVFKGGEIWK